MEKYSTFPADEQPLGPDDIACMVARPGQACISEMWVMPTDQV